MERTFHRHVGLPDFAVALVFALVALWALLHRTTPSVLVGLAFVVLAVLAVERMVHTVYTFTADDRLVVDRGRFARRIELPLTDVRTVRRVDARLLSRSYVVIEWGAESSVAVQPDHIDTFVAEIDRRLAKYSDAEL